MHGSDLTHKTIKVLWLVLSLVLLATAPLYSAFASPSTIEIPPGFDLILSEIGVQLYRKDYPGGTPDFVQVIDLSQGAVVKSMHGDITELRAGKGPYGGNDARMKSKTLGKYWQEAASANANTFCVTNGQFFYMMEYPTRLPFPLKQDGNMVTDGYGIADKVGEKLIFELWPGRADIQELTPESLYNSTAPDIIAGLTEASNKKPKNRVGRTFVGIDDANGDSLFEVILIYNTRSARQDEAAEVLLSFGADKVMMLDGGGSTQLLCQGNSYIFSERLIPQALAVIAGDGSPPPPVEPPAEAPPSEAPPSVAAPAQTETLVAEAEVQPPAPAPEENAAPQVEPPPAADAAAPPPADAGEAVEAPQEAATSEPLPTSPPAEPVEIASEESQVVSVESEGSSIPQENTSVAAESLASQNTPENGQDLPAPAGAVSPPLSATFVNLPGWPIVLVGEPVRINVEIQNSGTDTWKAGEYQLVVQKSPWGADEILPLQIDARPGDSIVFTWTTPPFLEAGVYSARWYLSRGEERSPEQPLTWSVVVIPPEFESLRPELQKELNLWLEHQEEGIDHLFQNWIQEQSGNPAIVQDGSEISKDLSNAMNDQDEVNIDLNNVAWIPAVMLPFAAVLMIAIGRNRYRY